MLQGTRGPHHLKDSCGEFFCKVNNGTLIYLLSKFGSMGVLGACLCAVASRQAEGRESEVSFPCSPATLRIPYQTGFPLLLAVESVGEAS